MAVTRSTLFIGLLVILLHEVGHLASAFSLGIRIKRMGLSWKGVYIVREPGPPAANMITTLAGPALNLFLAVTWPVFHDFALVNVTFGLLNLMPYAGSDGQRALKLARSAHSLRASPAERSHSGSI